jgi:hypothetical protein
MARTGSGLPWQKPRNWSGNETQTRRCVGEGGAPHSVKVATVTLAWAGAMVRSGSAKPGSRTAALRMLRS